MDGPTHVRLDMSQPDRATIWIDVANRPVNVLSEDVFAQLVQAFEQAALGARGLPIVLRSAKRTGFAVGADLRRIAAIKQDREIQEFLCIGQNALRAIEQSKNQTVALVEGACLGGGLELALACRCRFACAESATQLGLPEALLGLMPGWGGTQRLIETIGLESGIEMLLSGRAIAAGKAVEMGLVNAAAERPEFEAAVTAFLRSLEPVASIGSPQATLSRDAARAAWAAWRQAHLGPFSQAQQAILRAIGAGIEQSREAGLRLEREQFFSLLVSPVAQSALQRFAAGHAAAD
ncbi:MAG: enoyl-CoA hydratase-related protein [Aureliella sp.]